MTQTQPEARDKNKRAPVQGWPEGIPWSLHLEAYAVYSKKWAPQPALIDLEGRNCRGGFSVGELDEFIPGWREKVSEITRLTEQIVRLEAELAQLRESKPQCERTYNDEYFHWHTGCGNAHQFGDGGIHDNKYSHCPYCGGGIGEKTP